MTPNEVLSSDVATEAQPRPVSVLLVEDSLNMQAALTALFKTLGGLEVAACFIAELDATFFLTKKKPEWEIAVIDLVLFEGTGFNLIHRARAQNPRGTVIVLSAFVTQAITNKCVRFGADAVFAKTDTAAFADYILVAAEKHRRNL